MLLFFSSNYLKKTPIFTSILDFLNYNIPLITIKFLHINNGEIIHFLYLFLVSFVFLTLFELLVGK